MPRKERLPWYSTVRWQKRRAYQLAIQPLCAWCLEKQPPEVKAAEVVHHLLPHLDEQAFWFGPLVSLCKQCHDSTAQQIEKRGFSREIGIDGYPTDKQHHPFYQSTKQPTNR